MSEINITHETGRLSVLNVGIHKVIITQFIPWLDKDNIILKYNIKIWEKLQLPVNYIFCSSMIDSARGHQMDSFMKNFKNKIDDINYIVNFSLLTIPLTRDIVQIILQNIIDKKTLFGLATIQEKTKLEKLPKIKSSSNIFASPDCMGFSTELFNNLKCPSFREYPRAAEGEEISIRTQELGYSLNLMYPNKSKFITKEESIKFGVKEYENLTDFKKIGFINYYQDLLINFKNFNYPPALEFLKLTYEEIIAKNG